MGLLQARILELPFPSPGDLLDPGIESRSSASPALQAKSLLIGPSGRPTWLPWGLHKTSNRWYSPFLADSNVVSIAYKSFTCLLTLLYFWCHYLLLLYSLSYSSYIFLLQLYLPLCYQYIVCESEVAQSCLTLCDPVDYSLLGSSVQGIFQARGFREESKVLIASTSVKVVQEDPKMAAVSISIPRRSPCGLLSFWEAFKDQKVGCHFLLQGIFPTQGSNPGLPHCRQTLYHLSYWEAQYVVYIQVFSNHWSLISFQFEDSSFCCCFSWESVYYSFMSEE